MEGPDSEGRGDGERGVVGREEAGELVASLSPVAVGSWLEDMVVMVMLEAVLVWK